MESAINTGDTTWVHISAALVMIMTPWVGFFYASQMGKQLASIGAVWGYSFVFTFAILKVLDVVMGLRVSEEEERLGLDASQHGERGYVLEEAGPLTSAKAPAPSPRPTPQPVPQQVSTEAW